MQVETLETREPVFEIIVGNIGTMKVNGFEGWRLYGKYKRQSQSDYGRAAGESVTLLKDGEIIAEYIGRLDQD